MSVYIICVCDTKISSNNGVCDFINNNNLSSTHRKCF